MDNEKKQVTYNSSFSGETSTLVIMGREPEAAAMVATAAR